MLGLLLNQTERAEHLPNPASGRMADFRNRPASIADEDGTAALPNALKTKIIVDAATTRASGMTGLSMSPTR
jgi:hypothetical protein